MNVNVQAIHEYIFVFVLCRNIIAKGTPRQARRVCSGCAAGGICRHTGVIDVNFGCVGVRLENMRQ